MGEGQSCDRGVSSHHRRRGAWAAALGRGAEELPLAGTRQGRAQRRGQSLTHKKVKHEGLANQATDTALVETLASVKVEDTDESASITATAELPPQPAVTFPDAYKASGMHRPFNEHS